LKKRKGKCNVIATVREFYTAGDTTPRFYNLNYLLNQAFDIYLKGQSHQKKVGNIHIFCIGKISKNASNAQWQIIVHPFSKKNFLATKVLK